MGVGFGWQMAANESITEVAGLLPQRPIRPMNCHITCKPKPVTG